MSDYTMHHLALTSVAQCVGHHSRVKCHKFNSWSGHMSGLQAKFPVRIIWEATDWCFSHTSMFLSLPSSLSKNKKIFQKEKKKAQISSWSLAVLLGHKGWVTYRPPEVRGGCVIHSGAWNKSFLCAVITKLLNRPAKAKNNLLSGVPLSAWLPSITSQSGIYDQIILWGYFPQNPLFPPP